MNRRKQSKIPLLYLLLSQRLFKLPKRLLSAQNGKHSDLTSLMSYGNGCCHGFSPRFPYTSHTYVYSAQSILRYSFVVLL